MWTDRRTRLPDRFRLRRRTSWSSSGRTARVAPCRCAARPVAEFYADVDAASSTSSASTADIWPVPVEIPDAVPFARRPDPCRRTTPTRSRASGGCSPPTSRVLAEFRTTFVGKSSPVHLFWGALDLATTRFSGRPAPAHTGGAPNCGPHVMLEAYSQEVSSAGYWPGGGGEGVFYSYAYPEPTGYRDAPVTPAAARYDDELGEFVLPYEVVRTAARPARGAARLPPQHVRGRGRRRRLGPRRARARGAGVDRRRHRPTRTSSPRRACMRSTWQSPSFRRRRRHARPGPRR